jgi:outer membrane protein assembly factor BamD (BamD/ComL family)
MKKANLVLIAAMAAAGLTGVVGGSLLPVTAAVAASKDKAAAKQKLSPAVAKPLMAAQTAMNAKDWDAALTQLQAAQAVEPKTPYDAFMIDELGWYIQLQKKDYAQAAAALERAVGTEFVAEADRPQRLRALTQMYLQTQQYPKAIEFGTSYLQTNPGDTEIALALAQARYLSDDFAGAKTAAEQLIAAGGQPPEAALLLALRANYELKNDAGTTAALEGLVRHYPQPKYWEDLLNNQLFRTKDDRGLRALYRLMDDTGTLDKPDEYSEMGASLITGGFPNEAKQVLERGLSTATLDGAAKTRAQADLDRARSGAAVDAKDLPNAEKQLAAAKSGNEMVAIGKLYFSAGDYAKAADAIQKGLAKGGVTDADDANLLLGIAQSRSGNATAAAAAFDAVKLPALAEVARLWKLKLEAAPAPAAPPAAPAAAPPAAG